MSAFAHNIEKAIQTVSLGTRPTKKAVRQEKRFRRWMTQ